jgi:large subunit ribosomal protein L23
MKKKSPYDIIKIRYMSEKVAVLQSLQDRTSNASLKRCKSPKYVFLVDKKANKTEIAEALETIYAESKIRVRRVNTIVTAPKPIRRGGRLAYGPTYKKAIVTLEVGDKLPEQGKGV